MKILLKRTAALLGYEIHRRRPPAPGTDWLADLQRLLHGRTAPVLCDVGANRGDVSVRLAQSFPAPARIFAFEPARETFSALAARMAGDPHVHVEAIALGREAGPSTLQHGPNSETNRVADPSAPGTGSSEPIAMDTLDGVAARLGLARIDFIKTDTEGHDLAVLQGGTGLFQRGAIDAVLSEVTFESPADWHSSFEAIRDFLIPLGFCLHGIYEPVNWELRLKYANVLFVRESDVTPA